MHTSLFFIVPSLAWHCISVIIQWASSSFPKRCFSFAHETMSAPFTGPHNPSWTYDNVTSPSRAQIRWCQMQEFKSKPLHGLYCCCCYMHNHGAVASLWREVLVSFDELWVQVGLAAKLNILHCFQIHRCPWNTIRIGRLVSKKSISVSFLQNGTAVWSFKNRVWQMFLLHTLLLAQNGRSISYHLSQFAPRYWDLLCIIGGTHSQHLHIAAYAEL